MNALMTVPGHNDVINVHVLREIVRILKNKKAVGKDGLPSEVYTFASERLLTNDVNIPFRQYAYWYASEYPYARSGHTVYGLKNNSRLTRFCDPTEKTSLR